MKVFQSIIVYAVVLLIMVSVLEMAVEVQAVGTVEIVLYGERTETDINETDEPLIFLGWVNYTGISVLPLKVYLSVSANLGEPVLTESEFVFHIPANETFQVFIYVDNIDGNRSTGKLTLVAYWEQGARRGSGGEARGIYLVRNTSREEQLVEGYYGIYPQNNDIQAIGYLGFISFLIIIYSVIRRRLNNPKRIPIGKG